MSNYTYPDAVNFNSKDALPSGSASKVIQGAEFHDEFVAISTAVATKADLASPTFTGTVTFQGAATFQSAVTVPNITITGTVTGTIDGGTY